MRQNWHVNVLHTSVNCTVLQERKTGKVAIAVYTTEVNKNVLSKVKLVVG